MFTNVRLDFQGRYRTRRGIPPGASRRVPLGPDDETYTFNTARIVGGGSLLYTAITNTPYEADYQVWSDETGLDLSYQNLKYAAEEIERAFNIHPKPDGLLRDGDRLFRDSARALGIEVNPAKIAKQNCLWCGYCDGVNMCKYDARGGSFTGYLPTALEHGVEIIPDAKAEKVLIEKQGTGFRVTGVAYIRNGERQVVNAPRVVVSCGQYGSTPLLLRSGYGPKRLVEQLIVANPNVGNHTDARPWCEPMTAVFDQPISGLASTGTETWWAPFTPITTPARTSNMTGSRSPWPPRSCPGRRGPPSPPMPPSSGGLTRSTCEIWSTGTIRRKPSGISSAG